MNIQVSRLFRLSAVALVLWILAGVASAQGGWIPTRVNTAGNDLNTVYFVDDKRGWVGGDEGFSGKPTPAIFLEAARRIGVAPERCIVFEDAPFGIEAARRGGMRAVAVCSTHSATELAGPHVIAAVRDYNELAHSNFLETLDAVAA